MRWFLDLFKKSEITTHHARGGLNKEKLILDLRRDEGFKNHAYQDHLGYWTIGYGRLIDRRKGGRITREEAEYLLLNDVEYKSFLLFEKLPWLQDHPEAIQRALANMSFQMGVAGLLNFKRTLSLIQQREYNMAADNALKSKWARQTPSRAKRVTDLMRSAHKDIILTI